MNFQPMPELSSEQYDALKHDIETNGVLVPITVDQYGRIIDGNNRQAIAAEMGIDCPRVVKEVIDDNEAHGLALTLNCARRHLTQEQKRVLIGNEIQRRPDDSDRAIARRIGCSPSTVGAVRQPVSKLDTSPPGEMTTRAEETTSSIRDHLAAAREATWLLIVVALSNKIAISEIVTALARAQRSHELRCDNPAVADAFRTSVFGPLIDLTLAPATAEKWRPQWDHETFLPLTPGEQTELLADLAGGAR